jgi:hypothetical protein
VDLLITHLHLQALYTLHLLRQTVAVFIGIQHIGITLFAVQETLFQHKTLLPKFLLLQVVVAVVHIVPVVVVLVGFALLLHRHLLHQLHMQSQLAQVALALYKAESLPQEL